MHPSCTSLPRNSNSSFSKSMKSDNNWDDLIKKHNWSRLAAVLIRELQLGIPPCTYPTIEIYVRELFRTLGDQWKVSSPPRELRRQIRRLFSLSAGILKDSTQEQSTILASLIQSGFGLKPQIKMLVEHRNRGLRLITDGSIKDILLPRLKECSDCETLLKIYDLLPQQTIDHAVSRLSTLPLPPQVCIEQFLKFLLHVPYFQYSTVERRLVTLLIEGGRAAELSGYDFVYNHEGFYRFSFLSALEKDEISKAEAFFRCWKDRSVDSLAAEELSLQMAKEKYQFKDASTHKAYNELWGLFADKLTKEDQWDVNLEPVFKRLLTASLKNRATSKTIQGRSQHFPFILSKINRLVPWNDPLNSKVEIAALVIKNVIAMMKRKNDAVTRETREIARGILRDVVKITLDCDTLNDLRRLRDQLEIPSTIRPSPKPASVVDRTPPKAKPNLLSDIKYVICGFTLAMIVTFIAARIFRYFYSMRSFESPYTFYADESWPDTYIDEMILEMAREYMLSNPDRETFEVQVVQYQPALSKNRYRSVHVSKA